MTDADAVRAKLRAVFRSALDLPSDVDCEAVQFRKEPRWDSVAHLQLITELERDFRITIGNDDVLHLTSFDNVLRLLLRLTAAGGEG